MEQILLAMIFIAFAKANSQTTRNIDWRLYAHFSSINQFLGHRLL